MNYEDILKEMGFEFVTGTLWNHPQHPEYGFLNIDEHDRNAWGIMHALVYKGKQMKIGEVKQVLNIQ